MAAIALSLAACTGCPALRIPGRINRYRAGGSFIGAGPAVSPSGDLLVYASPRSGDGDLFVVRRRDGRVTRLTSDPEYEGDPSFFPDGRHLAFVRERAGVGEIWSIGIDGKNARCLVRRDRYSSAPVVSPDGRRIVFEGETRGDRRVALFRASRPDWAPSLITDDNAPESSPEYSADGRLLYYVRSRGEIWTMKPDGQGRTFRCTGSAPAPSRGGKEFDFALLAAPHNQTIAVVRTRSQQVSSVLWSKSYKARLAWIPGTTRVAYIDEPSGSGVGMLSDVDLMTGHVTPVCSTR